MREAVIVRTMRSGDAAEMAAIERLCFDWPWSESALSQEMDNASAYYAIIECGGRIAAYAGMHIVFDEAHVMNVATHPDFRRLGFARLVMRALMEEALIRGASSMTLEVRVENAPARTLYEKLGFDAVGIRPKYYQNGEDALICWLRDIRAALGA